MNGDELYFDRIVDEFPIGSKVITLGSKFDGCVGLVEQVISNKST